MLVGLVAAGCAGGGTAAEPALSLAPDLPTAPATPAPAGVDFPVTAVPRPIVLVGPAPVTVEWVGDEEEKVAQGHGYRFTGDEPPTPGPATVVLPDGPATLPLTGARDALTAMSAGARGGESIEVVGVELGTAAFDTDRGPLELPAWRFRSAFGSVYAWPAITPEAFWKLGEVRVSHHRATTSDGLELQVELGAPDPPCPGHQPTVKEPVVTEGETSVRIGARTTGGPVGGCAQLAVYRPQWYAVRLTEPLGARVLVHEDGAVIPVATR